MEEGRRSGHPSGFVVKNRSSSGCLVVRKKGGDVGPSVSHKLYESKKEKKRLRMHMSDSGSSDDELSLPAHRAVGPDTIRVSNGLSGVEESDIVRKRSRGEEVRRNAVGVMGRNVEDLSERKRNKLDVFEFDEYNGDRELMRRRQFDDGEMMEGRRIFGGMMVGRSGTKREYDTELSRHGVVDRRKSLYCEKSSGLSHGDHGVREAALTAIPILRDKYDSDEPIRVQGKNGVLKVMVNKKKKIDGSLTSYDRLQALGNRKVLRTKDTLMSNALLHPSFHSGSKSVEKTPASFLKPLPTKTSKASDMDSEDSDTSLKLGPKSVEARNSVKTSLSMKRKKDANMDSEDSDTSLKLGPKRAEARKPMKGTSSIGEKTPCTPPPETRTKEGKVKRGSGTEKQKLRERIREMLLGAGWTIDYRPRRNRDYLDAVYINPSGTAYWSIIKAYDALLKQLNDDEIEAKARAEASPFTPLADEVLNQLTRKTRKKIEKEMKKKQRVASETKNARESSGRKSSNMRFDEASMGSGSHEEKLSTFIKLGGKSLKGRMNDNGSVSVSSKGQSSSHRLHDGVDKKNPSGSDSHHGRKSRKLGRCTLLIRNTNEGPNSENDGFVPYSGKRTLLSWLIDCGDVQLSQKVRYMNRRRTKVLLEGWVTRDGIHCGCCSKILTVSKFEIHAGSKLRQPFQNIFLDSGNSILDCQIDAWNRLESVEHIGFHVVDTDGDDPNDDTCGLCGDGGDLICCDGCPSTFHLSCLDLKMLPPDDWHCPNCTCKFCGLVHGSITQGDDATDSMLLTCSLCAKKYHNSCMQDMDVTSMDSAPSFCGKDCSEIFEQLQKYLGVRHELEAGFSWSLIHRTDAELGVSLQGLPQRIECNSKLAVALSVMDECFLPVVDRRSGVNLIHNVLYNSGSNFNRLNFSGFYTALLERGDEIISAASIRFHGTRLAEMPFIGTRHFYRRQGMCRRLFGAIESALCNLRVEKLVIPAISELMQTWTEVFGFTTLDESQRKEMKNMNLLVFPGIDMLQKQLLEQVNSDGNRVVSTGTKQMELKGSTPEVANKSDMDCLAGHDHDEHDDGVLEYGSEKNELPAEKSDSKCLNVSSDDPCIMGSPLHASRDPEGPKSPVSPREAMDRKSESEDKLDGSKSDNRGPYPSVECHAVHDMGIKSEPDHRVEDNTQSCVQDAGSLDSSNLMSHISDVSNELQNQESREDYVSANSESIDKLPESTSGRNFLIGSDVSGNEQVENNPELVSLVKDNSRSCIEGDSDDASVLNLNESASDEIRIRSSEENECTNLHPEKEMIGLATERNCVLDSEVSNPTLEMETAPFLDLPVKSETPSCKEGDLGNGDIPSDHMACSEAIPSAVRKIAGNSPDKNIEASGVSVSMVIVDYESSMQISSEPTEIAYEMEVKSDLALNTVPETISFEEGAPHALGSDLNKEET